MKNTKLQYLIEYATESIDFMYKYDTLSEVGLELTLSWDSVYQTISEEDKKEIEEFNYRNYELKFIEEGKVVQVVKRS